jgi:hypothetical protein
MIGYLKKYVCLGSGLEGSCMNNVIPFGTYTGFRAGRQLPEEVGVTLRVAH